MKVKTHIKAGDKKGSQNVPYLSVNLTEVIVSSSPAL
jgi:hypothetical protein